VGRNIYSLVRDFEGDVSAHVFSTAEHQMSLLRLEMEHPGVKPHILPLEILNMEERYRGLCKVIIPKLA
jgi:hypothetical protein